MTMVRPTTAVHRMRRMAAYVWASPVTAAGAVVATSALLLGARLRHQQGVLEVGGGWMGFAMHRFTRIEAITLGHVVMGVNHERLARWREHERAHVAQYERYGVFMPLLYGLESMRVGLIPNRHHYWDNRFEREARLVDLKIQRRMLAAQAKDHV